jgi:NADH-quinone oxidoreductase subunit F
MKLLSILDKITAGKAKESDIDELERLSIIIKDTSLCGLGQSSPNPVLSTINHFRHEYLEHIRNKKCPAAVCLDLTTFEINQKCVKCTQCIKVCPVNAITGALKEEHKLSKELCIKCGKCVPACPVGAIVKV